MSGQAWRVAVIAGKGGVGKTTTVINLGAGLAALGRRVLVVDCDPQGNLTSGLGLDPYARRRTVTDVIVGRTTAVEAIVETETPGLHLIPSHPDLSAVEAELPARVNAELRLRNALRADLDSRYDVILFDTPPNFGFHTISALGAARAALVPLQMSAFALRGLKEVIRVLAAARKHLNPDLELLGVVPTFVNNTRFSRDMLEALGDVSQVRVFRSEIALTVRLQESALQGVPVLVSSPSSKAAVAYAALAEELVEVAGQKMGPASRRITAPAAPAAPVAPASDDRRMLTAEEDVDGMVDDDEDDLPVDGPEALASEMDLDDDAGDDDDDLDDGMAVTIAAEAGHGAVGLSTEDAMRSISGRRAARPRVMLELELGQGAVAYADVPEMKERHAADEYAQGEYAQGEADEAEAEAEASARRRRFWFFGRAKAS